MLPDEAEDDELFDDVPLDDELALEELPDDEVVPDDELLDELLDDEVVSSSSSSEDDDVVSTYPLSLGLFGLPVVILSAGYPNTVCVIVLTASISGIHTLPFELSEPYSPGSECD